MKRFLKWFLTAFGILVLLIIAALTYRYLTLPPVVGSEPSWSPNGSMIAFTTERDGNREIYLIDTEGNNITRLTTSDEPEHYPVWSPDGSKIAFCAKRDVGMGNPCYAK